MNDPRNITDADEIQELLETRHEVHFNDGELVFELDDGGLLSVRPRANYLYAVYYPPGWRDGVEGPEPDTATAMQEHEQEDKARVLWLLVMLVMAALAAAAYWMGIKS